MHHAGEKKEEKVNHCRCGSAYCGRRSLRRDAASTFVTLARSSDPEYGTFTGLFWGGLLLLGVIVAIVDRVPSRDWPAIGAWAGAAVLLFAAVTGLSIRERRRDARKR